MLRINSNIKIEDKEEGHTLYNFFCWYLGMKGWDDEDNLYNIADNWESQEMFNYLIDNEFEDYYKLVEFINANKCEIIDVKNEYDSKSNLYGINFIVKDVPFVLVSVEKFSWDKVSK